MAAQKMFGPYPGVIRDWHDGDSCHVELDLGFGIHLMAPVACRVWGINAPELKLEEGKAARDYAREICPPGTDVSVTSHGWDKYSGRFDGQITLPDGNDFAELMMDSGHAIPLTF